MWVLIFQRLFIEAFLDLFYFPLWWYTLGAKHALFWCINLLKYGNEMFAPGMWLQNIFVPMYGQYDWQGRMISFFMRLAQVVFRFIALIIWLVICILLFFVWLALPIVVIAGILSILVN